MSPKELVLEYYNSDALRRPDVMGEYIHNGFLMQWHSSKGYLEADKADVMALAEQLGKSYITSRIAISHIIEEGNQVSVKYTHYVTPLENPDEEMVLGHFFVFWELKDNKLYKAYLMSQLG
jgi:hypothetical protein